MNKNIKGYVSFVLHAHLPFVHHPESEDYLEEQWLFEAIKEAVDKGMVIINITQCPNGEVMPHRYMTGLELAQTGVVPGHDLTSEAAITKLMYLLGRGLKTNEVRHYMECNLCGEMS